MKRISKLTKLASLCALTVTAAGASNFSGSLYYTNQQLNNKKLSPVVVNHVIDADVSWDNLKKKKNHQKFKASARMNDKGATMISIEEASLNYKLQDGGRARFGRYAIDWAPLDDIWGTGIINNRKNFDLVDHGNEGVIGLNAKFKLGKNWAIEGFGSYLYVPELNPMIEEEDGKLTSKSEWAELPPAYANLGQGGTVAPINYTLNKPKLADIVFKPSYGISGGLDSKHWIAKGFYMHKPENTFRVSATVSTNASAGVIDAQIYPELYNENIFGGQMSYRNKSFQVDTMILTVRPESTPQSSALVRRYLTIETRRQKEDYFMTGFTRKKKVFSWGVYYLHLFSGAPAGDDTLGNKPKWSRSIKTKFSLEILKDARWKFDMTHDVEKEDTVLSTGVEYDLARGFKSELGIRAISAPNDGTYWAPFRGNDAVYVKLGHVF